MTTKKLYVQDDKFNEQIDNIAQLYYKKEGLSELVSVTKNPSILDIIINQYTDAYRKWKEAVDELGYKVLRGSILETASYTIDINFQYHSMEFAFEDRDDEDLTKVVCKDMIDADTVSIVTK